MNHDIKKAIDVLRKGGVILYPTDTVWGIGCDATSSEAVRKLYEIKRRNAEPALVLVYDIDMIYRYVREVPAVAVQLIEVADKPLTVVLPNACGLAPEITGADGSIGIRPAYHEYCHNLLKMYKKPIVSTSANISGQPAPKHFNEISPEILNGIDYAVDAKFAGKMTGTPSSIIKVGLAGEIEIIRK
ncbi:MAG: threonylcarbamoyl-AMP synthase [Prevotellaceae bacterium]|jgi:L-threonylcarbamoyladenylate synthase|nr:threonylcarbamoyl-AMP synthase [Prevotellaceae bacterium]